MSRFHEAPELCPLDTQDDFAGVPVWFKRVLVLGAIAAAVLVWLL